MKSWLSVGDTGLHTHIDMVEETGQGRGMEEGEQAILDRRTRAVEAGGWRVICSYYLA